MGEPIKEFEVIDDPDESEAVESLVEKIEQGPPPKDMGEPEPEPPQGVPDVADLRDSKGETFNPEIHVTDSDGRPVLTKTRKLRRKVGRKRGGVQASKSTIDQAVIGGTDQHQTPNGSLAAAVAMVGAVEMGGIALGGDEWRYKIDPTLGIDEKRQGIEVWAEYFRAQGVTDIPPGIAVAIWSVSYMAPRFFQPATKNRIGLAWAWMKSKLGRKNVAHSDSRENGKRKDDESGSTGASIPGS